MVWSRDDYVFTHGQRVVDPIPNPKKLPLTQILLFVYYNINIIINNL